MEGYPGPGSTSSPTRYMEGYPGPGSTSSPTRETRDRGGPCLLKLSQLETQGVRRKRVLPWLVQWARRACTRYFCPALSGRRTSKNYFTSFVPMAHQAGQIVAPRRLSLNKCLCPPTDCLTSSDYGTVTRKNTRLFLCR
jgi:hypothetical protein